MNASEVPDSPALPTEHEGGRFSLLTINVAEQGMGRQEQSRLAKTGLLLQSFDIVLLQGNYRYRELMKQAYSGQLTLAELESFNVQSPKDSSDSAASIGLNTLAHFETGRFAFFRWFREQSAKHDEKDPLKQGVTVSTVTLKGNDGLSSELDVYNINLIVEPGQNTSAEVNQQLTSLLEFVAGRDKQGLRPLILSGHIDLSRLLANSEELAVTIVQRLQTELNAVQVFSSLHGFVGDHKGRWLFYRSGDEVRLQPLEAILSAKQFRGERGRPLILEVPAAASFNWFVKKDSGQPQKPPETDDSGQDSSSSESDSKAEETKPEEPDPEKNNPEKTEPEKTEPEKTEPEEPEVVIETVDDEGNLVREEP
ncbi:hypothetical protein GZ77_07770 [Endozoicomonas montiporae]|uniref:Endonuclease/exonuclease/phosphatase domain-containing protein n=2 Tax=Endozoicomonas montiporae TaxID=1027273 RepID=A0A081N774_9GAMM|nr:hypothetical protein [Endozoicomonas montiporae]KEQ14297.1 hypothetical protein GZ77_07770 [Endozoicomonas montiporae]